MSPRGPRAVQIVLSDAERRALERMTHGESRRRAERAGIVLACASGSPNSVVAHRFSVSVATVGKWRSRFARQRLAGLADEPRPGRPKSDLEVPRSFRTWDPIGFWSERRQVRVEKAVQLHA